MRVLHLFDKYLNTTMNWAHLLMSETPETEVVVAAPLYVRNRFYNPRFEFVHSPLNQILGISDLKDEWTISWFQTFIFKLNKHFVFKYFLKKLIKHKKIDVVHAHFANVACHYLPVLKSLNLPLVVSFYGYDYEHLLFIKPHYKVLYARLFEQAAAIICEGEHGVQLLHDMGCAREKLHVVKLGLKIDKSLIVKVKEKKSDSLMLVQAASFLPKKGIIYTIKAFAKVLKTCPNMHLTLVGERADSDYYDSIVALIAEEKLSDFVDIKDFVKSDFNAFLSQYDVFIHPSCYSDARDCEGGAPIVLLNAQSQGLPIISTTHCDIPSEVLHGQTGLLSPEKDVDSLAKNIGLFYTMDNVEYQWYSKNTIQHVENEYDIEKSAKVLAKIYKNISGV